MDNSKLAKKTYLTALRDKWLITYGKSTLKIKTQIKTVAEAEKKRPKKRTRPGKKSKERARL